MITVKQFFRCFFVIDLVSTFKTITEFVRATPEKSVPPKQARQDRLTDLLFVLLIFSVSYWLKFFVVEYYLGIFGDNNAFRYVNGKDELYWLTNLFGWEQGGIYEVEGYADFDFYYIPYVDNFSVGWNPYEGSSTATFNPERMDGYVYGPLYIFFISIGKMYFGLTAEQSVWVSNIVFDSLCSVMVYVLGKRYTGNVIAFIAAMFNSVVPISLFYANIYGLNTPQMTFFALLYLWFFLEHHDTLGFAVLAMGFMTKQFPLLFAMPALMFMVRRYGWLRGISFLIVFIMWSLLFSLPYIVVTPTLFIIKLFLAGRAPEGVPTYEYLEQNQGIAPNLVSSAVGNQNYDFALFLDPLVNSQLLFVGSLFVFSYFGFSAYRIMEERPYLYLRFAAAFYFLAHGTIARGIYKYYTPFLIPFLILALIPYTPNGSPHIRLGHFVKLGFNTWLDPKYRLQKPSLTYWGLFLVLIGSLTGIILSIDWMVSLFVDDLIMRNVWKFFIYLGIIVSIAFPSPSKTPKTTGEKDISPEKVQSAESTTEITNPLLKKIEFIVNENNWISVLITAITILAIFSYFHHFFFEGGALLALYNSFGIVIIAAGILFQIIQLIIVKHKEVGDEWLNKSKVLPASFAITVLVFYVFMLPNFRTVDESDTSVSFALTVFKVATISSSSLFLAYVIDIVNETLKSGSTKKLTYFSRRFDLSPELIIGSVILGVGMYLVEILSNAFFKGNDELLIRFLVNANSMILLLFTFAFLYFKLTNKSNHWLNLHSIVAFFDFLRLSVMFSIVFLMNIMILTVPRLLNPALIFVIGIVLMGYMTADYWNAFVSFHKRVYTEFKAAMKHNQMKT